MRFVLDAGALVALDRGDRAMWGHLAWAAAEDLDVRTHGGVVGQVWRGGGPRQARLSRALAGVEVLPLDEKLGKTAGAILAKDRSTDVVDAGVVCIAASGDEIFTSDSKDIARLAKAAAIRIRIRTI